MEKRINIVTMAGSVVLAFVLGLYIFTPVLDEWVIEKSLKRFCGTVKEEFLGQFYSPAYLCTFIEGTE